MTNEEIERLIDSLNAGKCLIELLQISDNVAYGDVSLATSAVYPDMFFIRNDEGMYVAGVLDMKFDLHVFVKSEYRKQGHLTKAMNDVIFPYLRDHFDRDIQRVTFIDKEVGEYIQRCWGFTITNEGEAEKIL